ncbi:MAG: serine hydrolase [Pyrinomonadaceae bacterium]
MSIAGTVDMPLNVKDHVPVIEAKINGRGPYRFELDTGFGGMMQVKESLAAQLNLSVIGEARSGDPSGRNPSIVRLLRAESVDVGTAHFEGVIVSESKRQRSADLDGVIGLNLFNKLKVRLDYVGNRFGLTEGTISPDHSQSYTTEHGVPTVEIVVNGTRTKVDIDSGSPGEVTLPLSMAKSLTLKSEPFVAGRGRTADGEFEVYRSELKGDVGVGGIILNDPSLDFISVFPIGNLGFRFLSGLIVTFDPANKRVLFERPAVSDVLDLSKSVSGKRASAYFAAFNSGDDAKLAAFFSENTDGEALKRRPVEPRVAFHKQVRSDFKQLAIKKVVSVTGQEINVLAQSPSGEWASITFEIEGSAGKFAGVMVERIEAPRAESPVPAAPTTKAELTPAVERLMDGLVKADAFSGVVMIAHGDKPVFTKAYGLADASKKIDNNRETRFNLGSINKMFTRIAIGQLVSQGKLSFNDRLIKLLPDYPNREAASKITIGQLVTMTSGIGDFFNEKFEAADKSKICLLKDYLPFFVNDPLIFEPGTDKRYSNGGYLVLGLVIEKLSGKDYYDYVRENIFKPAGMSSSDSFAMDALPANTAVGYASQPSGKRTPNVAELPARGSSAGGGYSTADDMLRFSIALKTKKLVIPNDDGTFPADFTGAGFAGGSPGVNSLFVASSKTGHTLVVLSNFDPPSAEKPGSLISDWLKQLKQ